MAKKIIIWKKWIDPFDPDEDDIDLGDEEEDDEEEEERPYTDSYERMERRQEAAQGGSSRQHHGNNSAGPLLVGPMGVIPLNEHNQPSKVFKFWMGHTNFDIGETEKNIIEATPGVETLEVYTRYRIRISIGIAFEEEEVMDEIESRLCPQQEKPAEVKQEPTGLDKFKKHLGSKYKYWAIFVLPDGQLDYRTGDTQDSVKEKIESYPTQADVLTSWEVNNDADKVAKKASNKRGVQHSAKK